MNKAVLADIDVSKLNVLGPQTTASLWFTVLACLLFAVALGALAWYLGRPRPQVTKVVSSHSSEARSNPWRIRVQEILEAYQSDRISKEEAFLALAQTARDFASNATGRNMGSHTLLDLNIESRNVRQRGLDLLRQTIAALYPPEFADAMLNSQARDTTVDEASDWVLNLIDRWGR